MNLLADENVDFALVDRLRQDGHSVDYVAEFAAGDSDERLLNDAHQTASVLLTADKDFGELVFRMGRIHQGVILLRLAGLSVSKKCEITSDALQQYGSQMENAYTVTSPGGIRIRRTL